jgi:putative phage-type endonuclease
MTLSPSQIDARLAGISATDVAAIIGVNPYCSAVQVWAAKRGEGPPPTDTERSTWGERLEPLIRDDYAQRHGVHVERRGTLAHLDRPWMLASPDGLVYSGGADEPDRGLEIKTHTIRLRHLYGDPGTDEVPPYELCQCAWGMAVTGLPRWDLVVFMDNQPAEYVIDRDDELIAGLQERAERFLVDNVRGGAPPDPDGSEMYSEWLKARWAKNRPELIDIGNELETWALIDQARDLKALLEAKGEALEKIIQTLKVRVGDAGGLTWRDANGRAQKITWTRNKPSARVDVDGMITDVRNRAGLAASANVREIREVLPALRQMGGHLGSSTVSGVQLSKIIETLVAELTGIARVTHKAYTTEIPGNRPWCWPRSWSTKTGAK